MGRVIEQLPVRNYSRRPRWVLSFRGENSGIRLIDYKDKVDMNRLEGIFQSLSPVDFRPFLEDDQSLIDQVRNSRPTRPWAEGTVYSMGVAGLHGVPQEEIGELQGWIGLYPTRETEILDLSIQGKVLPPVKGTARVVTVEYGRRKEAPVGQMASGLRQTCALLLRSGAYENHEGVDPELIVLAYVRPRNLRSQQVLKAAGFVRKARGYFDFESQHFVYVLDWDKLHRVMQEKADRELFGDQIQ